MGTYLLGIDIGTSACKVAVFTEDGLAAATASVGYPVYDPRPGWAEQDPDEWWEAVCLAVRQVLELGGIDPAEIAGVGSLRPEAGDACGGGRSGCGLQRSRGRCGACRRDAGTGRSGRRDEYLHRCLPG